MAFFGTYILTALALVFIIEGLFYGFFTQAARKMMEAALQIPLGTLRNFGFGMASIGFLFLWLIEKF